jgi:hypothetical protein
MDREHEARREEREGTGAVDVAVGKRSLVASRYPALAQALGDQRSASAPTIHDAATAAVEHKGSGEAVDRGSRAGSRSARCAPALRSTGGRMRGPTSRRPASNSAPCTRPRAWPTR